ncbi:hypothetical protein AGMMS49975_18000 [Clostridia bacterium]|nr:hypothetical protein AGMMS49975_18000 [Clostridia bacterium]
MEQLAREKIAAKFAELCEQDGGVFHPDGCTRKLVQSNGWGNPDKNDFEDFGYEYVYTCNNGKAKCLHSYCDHYAGAIEKAQTYAVFFKAMPDEILEEWERNRKVWVVGTYFPKEQRKQWELPVDCRTEIYNDESDYIAQRGKNGFWCGECGKEVSNPSYHKCRIVHGDVVVTGHGVNRDYPHKVVLYRDTYESSLVMLPYNGQEANRPKAETENGE